ncbi:MAG: response regulator transcription factor [Ardenticatenaceae bacterium]|nr:response regulator transcription factor [Ardenticatenaceae bacterium]
MGQIVLIVEDEQKIARWVETYFRQAGFRTLVAFDGTTGLAMARHERPNLVVLDLMLPGIDGLDVCRALRREGDVPIIMLTARAEEADRLIGLELGADDYVVKPFSPRELVARARAVLRRSGAVEPPRGDLLRGGEVTVDVERRSVSRGETRIDLTPTEFDLLVTLLRHRGRPLSREQLIELALGQSYTGYDRTVDAHIKNLRRKIEPNPGEPRYILTVFGIGYKFAEDV